jgi:hypothetical protein
VAFRLVITIKQRGCLSFHALQKRFLCWVKPSATSLVLGTRSYGNNSPSLIDSSNDSCTKRMTGFSWCSWQEWAGTWKQELYLVQPGTRLALAS